MQSSEADSAQVEARTIGDAADAETSAATTDGAAEETYVQLMDDLWMNTTNVDERNENGSTALMSAAARGNAAVVQYLLDRGADVMLQDCATNTALSYAVVREGNVDVIQCLLEAGADIDARGDALMSPLASAALLNHMANVDYLIRAGADMNTRDEFNATPLHHLAFKGDLAMVEHFLWRGASINLRSDPDSSPLAWAVFGGQVPMMEYLIGQGLSVQEVDRNGRTLLMYVGEKQSVEVMELLLNEGVDMNAVEENGMTALHIAAETGRAERVKYLLSRGAAVDPVTNDLQHTPLMFAANYWHLEVVKVLVEHGANVHAADANGDTAVLHAINHHHKEVAEYFTELLEERVREVAIVAKPPQNSKKR